MSLQRTVRQSLVRPFAPPAFAARTQVRFATQDYGSGAGDPKGEKPQEQGKNPSEDKEHPGPPSPNTSGSGSKSGGSSSQPSGGKAQETSGSKKGTQGNQPKILNDNPPKEGEQSSDVQQHNREMDNRADQAHEKVKSDEAIQKDKVGKDFWRSPDANQEGKP